MVDLCSQVFNLARNSVVFIYVSCLKVFIRIKMGNIDIYCKCTKMEQCVCIVCDQPVDSGGKYLLEMEQTILM